MSTPYPLDVNTGQPVRCPSCEECPPQQTDAPACPHPLHWAGADPARPYFADVEVQLTGEDGNAFLIMGRVSKALRRHGDATNEQVEAFRAEFRAAGSYADALGVTERWVEVA